MVKFGISPQTAGILRRRDLLRCRIGPAPRGSAGPRRRGPLGGAPL